MAAPPKHVMSRRDETSRGAADRLIQSYSLPLANFPTDRDDRYASALGRAAAPLNTVALVHRFAPLPGVRFATRNPYVGDGDDIVGERHADGWTLSFSRGSGDCPAGCNERAS